MFSNDKESGRAVCLEDYGRIKRGAIVPVTNELYADVQQWIDEGNELSPFDGYPDIPPEPEEQKRLIRAERDGLLRETDYAVMPDYPISDSDLKAVKEYRQALRDVPQQSGFPDSVEWPAKPTV
jgi:hypothetical protein